MRIYVCIYIRIRHMTKFTAAWYTDRGRGPSAGRTYACHGRGAMRMAAVRIANGKVNN